MLPDRLVSNHLSGILDGIMAIHPTLCITRLVIGLAIFGGTLTSGIRAQDPQPENELQLMGNRFLTLNTVVRVRQIEVSGQRRQTPSGRVGHIERRPVSG